MNSFLGNLRFFVLVFWLLPMVAVAQWTHRYPKLDGYRHHVYVEGFELPILAAGPTDPAPAPDGKRLAFAASGWLWILDLDTGRARRLTDTSSLDSRPSWSVDGQRLVFLRDDTEDIDIWAYDFATSEEKPLVETPAIELDPSFSPDGEFLYYSSALAGDVDIWRLQLSTSESMRLTTASGLEVRPLPLPDGGVVYLSKTRGGADALIEMHGQSSEAGQASYRTLATQSIVSQTHPGISPDGHVLAVNWPSSSGYSLNLVDRRNSDVITLRHGAGLPLSPAFSADGRRIYFVEANASHELELHQISVDGGEADVLTIRDWDWGTGLGPVRLETHLDGNVAPARLSVTRADGHPMVHPGAIPRFDGTHGLVYFYSDGVVSMELPVGDYRVRATHGFVAAPVETTFRVEAGRSTELAVELERMVDPRAKGWLSGDHHYHMNYGGPYRLVPTDLARGARAEDLDFVTPLMANLHHRLNDLQYFLSRGDGNRPWIEFGQEVRSHFLGHLGLVHSSQIFWPWFWGPGYPVYAADDRPNLDALRHARQTGGMATYMHPISVSDPFADETSMRSIPLSFIPDAVLGDLDAIELACLWTSESGTAELWYRVLNLGVPLAANAGTDAMVDYYRTMAVGATRIYVDMKDQRASRDVYLERLLEGRSFVTTGPILEVTVDGKRPGEVVEAREGESMHVAIDINSVVSVDRVEIVVNGSVVWSADGEAAPFTTRHDVELELPKGGWLAARVSGEQEQWPGMNGSSFAHSSPVWIGKRGSRDPEAAVAAAGDLLAALKIAESRLRDGYATLPTPRLDERFSSARQLLEDIRQR